MSRSKQDRDCTEQISDGGIERRRGGATSAVSAPSKSLTAEIRETAEEQRNWRRREEAEEERKMNEWEAEGVEAAASRKVEEWQLEF
ncbi:hypothetical protein FF1_015733 [Malus domestica]